MTTFLLIRHASHDWLGKGIPGRTPGVTLNEQGRTEAEELSERLADAGICAIHSSPRERARDTALPLSTRLGLTINVEPQIDEVDFGDWTGCGFDTISRHHAWQDWVERKSIAQAPNGEAFAAVQQRALDVLERLRREYQDAIVALFSHSDVIKAVVATHLGMSLDDLERFDIAPASVSTIDVGAGWSKVKLVNDRGRVP